MKFSLLFVYLYYRFYILYIPYNLIKFMECSLNRLRTSSIDIPLNTFKINKKTLCVAQTIFPDLHITDSPPNYSYKIFFKYC